MVAKLTWMSRITGIPFLPFSPTGLTPLPIKWFMTFGAPLHLSARHGPAAAEDRLLVNQLTDEVRSTIQVMVDDTLSRRSSLVFG